MLRFPENKKFDAVLLGRVALDINPVDFTKTFAENPTFHKYVGGDAYSSAFLSALLKGLPIKQCLERGTASASLAVPATNCSDALPTEETLVNFIKEAHTKGVQTVFEN